MAKADFETQSLVYITLTAYVLNLLLGAVGFFCSNHSPSQLVVFQIGNAFAILASVMAGRYTGIRGQHVAASAYILLGITHGISLAALSRTAINADRGMTMAMPMIPALMCIFWCHIYPMWLRVAGLIPVAMFTLVYCNALSGKAYFDWPLFTGYTSLQTIEVLWGVYLLKDWKEQRKLG